VIQINSLCKIKEGAVAGSYDPVKMELNHEFLIKSRNLWGIIIDFLPDRFSNDFYKIKVLGFDKPYYFCYNDFNIVEEEDEFYEIDEVQSILKEVRNGLCEQKEYP
jgi:hypothetical protein